MIPLKLQLKNFLSYGSSFQEIDFSSHTLICFSGKNGHGKSALLDAMTWALWGQARKVASSARADDGLMRLGQTQMAVIFDFLCNGNQYRVKREFAKQQGKSLLSLEFGVLNTATNEFISLTDKTSKITQFRIDEAIRFNFESFVNSVFLRQSNANEFSKKSPKERKEILASILGLDRYETVKKLALEKVRHATTDKQALSAVYEKQRTELSLLSAVPDLLEQMEEEVTVILKQENMIQNQIEEIEKKLATLTEEIRLQQQKNNRVKELEKYIVIAKDQIKQRIFVWRKSRVAQIGGASLEILEEKKRELIEAVYVHQKQFQEHLLIKEQILSLQKEQNVLEQEAHKKQVTELKEAEVAGNRLVMELQSTESIISTIAAEIQKIDQEIISVETVIKKDPFFNIDDLSKKIAFLDQKLERHKALYHTWVARYNTAQESLRQLNQKKSFSFNDQSSSCPLCEQNLSASRRRFLQAKFDQEEQHIIHQYARLKRILPLCKNHLIQENEVIKREKNKLEQAIEEQKQHELFLKKVEDLYQQKKVLSKQLNIQQEKAKTIEQQSVLHQEIVKTLTVTISLVDNKMYNQIVTSIEKMQKKVAELSYDPLAQKQIEMGLSEIENQITEKKKFKEIKEQREREFQDLANFCKKIKEIKSELFSLKKGIQNLNTLEQEEEHLSKKRRILIDSQKQLHQKKDHLFEQKGRLLAQDQSRKQRILEMVEYEKKIAEKSAILSDYQMIAQATGKDGIQALLIEDAIPEIEHEANLLLSKLTDNQAQLFIESLKDLKKGGTKETLDIKITDQMGIRPYELFSGGEAFRIDFALRIAISKLLARRAGTELQTLIIDEGFGSQDEEGLSHIMDAIYAIQSEFAKIIIVSHLSALKDQFPVHFIVEKRTTGSCVRVVEQG